MGLDRVLIIVAILTIWPHSANSQSSDGLLDTLDKFLGSVGDAIDRQLGASPRGSNNAQPETPPNIRSQNLPFPRSPQQPAAPNYNRDRQLTAEVQRLLNSLGYDAGPVDGTFGQKTHAAVKAYQRDLGVNVTGDVTPNLIKQLQFLSNVKNTHENGPISPQQTKAKNSSAPPANTTDPKAGSTNTANLTSAPARPNLKNPVVPDSILGPFGHGTYPSIGNRTHVGVDLAAPCGSPVFAFADGEVIDAIHDKSDHNFDSLGFMVLLRHAAAKDGKPVFSLYLHLAAPPVVNKGDSVKGGGDQIGIVGDTGAAEGCHTHFEVRHFPGRFHPTWKNIYLRGPQADTTDFKWWWSDPQKFFAETPSPTSNSVGYVARDHLVSRGSQSTQNTGLPARQNKDQSGQDLKNGLAAFDRGNHGEAMKFLKPLAEEGNVNAVYKVGVMYLNGLGVKPDTTKGKKWILEAAERGDVSARLLLGQMFQEGRGVLQDFAQAYMWFSLAALGGNKESVALRDKVADRMSPNQIAEGQKLAREWGPTGDWQIREAIRNYYRKYEHGVCILDSFRTKNQPNTFTALASGTTKFQRNKNKLTFLERKNLVSVTGEKHSFGYRIFFKISELGRRQFTGRGNALCIGRKNLLKVERFTQPSTAFNGMKITKVTVIYQIGALPDWAVQGKALAVFPELGDVTGGQKFRYKELLIETNEGWVHEKMVK